MNRMIEDLAEQEEIRRNLLTRKPANINVIDEMAKTNSWNYNLDKTIEELFELGEVLMKSKLKKGGPKEPSTQSIIEEIGDVEIRIKVLRKLFGEQLVDQRVDEKLSKFRGFLEQGKYIGTI